MFDWIRRRISQLVCAISGHAVACVMTIVFDGGDLVLEHTHVCEACRAITFHEQAPVEVLAPAPNTDMGLALPDQREALIH